MSQQTAVDWSAAAHALSNAPRVALGYICRSEWIKWIFVCVKWSCHLPRNGWTQNVTRNVDNTHIRLCVSIYTIETTTTRLLTERPHSGTHHTVICITAVNLVMWITYVQQAADELWSSACANQGDNRREKVRGNFRGGKIVGGGRMSGMNFPEEGRGISEVPWLTHTNTHIQLLPCSWAEN